MLVLKSRIDAKPQFLYAKTQSRKQTKTNKQTKQKEIYNTEATVYVIHLWYAILIRLEL